jgi:hypothetical protein
VFGLEGKYTQLSYQFSHVKNYFACCSVNLAQKGMLAKGCSTMSYRRAASPTCAGSRYSVWSAAVGDPHFITSDGAKYTFNGVGEYWYVYSKDVNVGTKVQVRFVKAVDFCK